RRVSAALEYPSTTPKGGGRESVPGRPAATPSCTRDAATALDRPSNSRKEKTRSATIRAVLSPYLAAAAGNTIPRQGITDSPSIEPPARDARTAAPEFYPRTVMFALDRPILVGALGGRVALSSLGARAAATTEPRATSTSGSSCSSNRIGLSAWRMCHSTW